MNIKASLRVKLLAAFVIVLVVSSAVAVFGYKTQVDRSETIGWIDHTNEVITAADATLIGLINMETGFRGYMATGDENFLEPYHVGEVEVAETLAELKELTSDNPAQVARWEEIEVAWHSWQAEWIEPGIAIRELANNATHSADALHDVIAEGRGKESMDELRGVLHELENEMVSEGNLGATVLVAQLTEDIVNQETGMRGFIVTGEEGFLDPYTGGQADWVSLMAALQPSLAGSASAQDLAERTDALSAQWQEDAAEPWIAARRGVNENPTTVDDVAAYVDSGGGKQFMDLMRLDLAEAREVEHNLLVEREEADATATALASSVTIFGTLAAIVAGLSIAFFLSHNISNAVNVIAKAAAGIAAGDLDQQVQVESKDELGAMATTFQQMIAYLREMSAAARLLAQGDLTAKVAPQSEKDELGNAFAQMIANLRDIIGTVSDNTASVEGAASGLLQISGQAGQATSQIAGTIQQIAQGTVQQSSAVTETAGTVEQVGRAIDGVAKGAQEQATAVASSSEMTAQISTAVQQVAANAQAGAKGAAEEAESARDGAQKVDATVAGMESIREKVGLSAEKVQEMGQRPEEIGAIVETIDDIASQTNLLALNAAIEAARAGEHGKGFAVVADEVRKLAERASGATREISDLIKNIQKTVAEAVTAMNDGATEVEAGVERANESGQALADILEGVEQVTQQVEEIASAAEEMENSTDELVKSIDGVSAVVEENTAATEEMSAGSSEVTQAMENIASISEQNSAAAEEVSAATVEMTAQVDEVTTSAQILSDLASTLQQAVSQFTLSTNGDGEAASRPRLVDETGQHPGGAPTRRGGRGGATVGEQAQAEQGALVASSPASNGRQYEKLPVAGGD